MPLLRARIRGEPGRQPASRVISILRALKVPSLVAPDFTRMKEPLVPPVDRNTSSRAITNLTGRPAFLERRTARGSRQA